MLISIRHVSRYDYAEPAGYAIQSLRLTPASFKGQRVVDWIVRTPSSAPQLRFKDGFGNFVQVITIHASHSELTIEASGVVETTDCNGVVSGLPEATPPRVFLRETPQTEADDAIKDVAAALKGKDLLNKLHDLMGSIRDRVDYFPGVTGARTTAAEALKDGKGVCQDHAHIFISAARTLGIPSRYVTGYLVLNDAVRSEAHHAWAEAWVDSLGWVGFDTANRICPTDRYVRLACGLDAGFAAPIVGSRRGGREEKLNVSVDVAQQNAQQ